MDEIKVKERDLGVQAAHARKLQQQNQAVNDQLAVIRDLSPKKEVPYSPGAGDTADNTANPVSKFHSPPNHALLVNVAPICCSENNMASRQEVALILKLLQSSMMINIKATKFTKKV